MRNSVMPDGCKVFVYPLRQVACLRRRAGDQLSVLLLVVIVEQVVV
jgi:hypothetical protein